MSGFNANGGPQSAGENLMPWDAKSFAAKHNHKLAGNPGVAKKAAAQASAMVREGVPEGTAIATANKRANRLMKRGVISKRAYDRHGLVKDDNVEASSA